MLSSSVLSKRSAVVSDCGSYRYLLTRPLVSAPSRPLSWLMLNPSTADALVDDRTIGKVIGFTERAGYDAVVVVNLFAWRATKPRVLRANLADAEGDENFHYVEWARRNSDAMVFAWGANGDQPWCREQVERVRDWVGWFGRRDQDHRPILCIGGRRTKGGSPLHPLMQPYSLGLQAFHNEGVTC